MNQYQLIGLVVLGLALVLAGLTFWPLAGSPPTAVDEASLSENDVGSLPNPTAPKQSTPQQPAGAGARVFVNGFYVTTIVLTDQGFSPRMVEIRKGEEVRFVNRSTNTQMHIVADERTSSLYYRSINQSKTVARGGEYQLGLPELGIFNYYNLNSNDTGQIIVK